MYKTNKKLLFLSLVLLIIISISNVLSADVYTNGCWSGNLTSNTNYYLTQDIDVTTANSCFANSNYENVIIDCQNYEKEKIGR